MFPFLGRGPDCERTVPLLSSYLDRRLPLAEEEWVREHVAACAACAEELRSLEETVALLQGLPMLPVPRSFTLAVPSASHTGWFFFLRAATAAAATCLVAVLMLLAVLPAEAPPSSSVLVPTVERSVAKTSRAAENRAGVVAEEGTVALAEEPLAKASPSPLPTATPEFWLAVQPASAPPEEPAEEDSFEAAITPTPSPLALVQESPEHPAGAMWPLSEVAYGLLGGVVVLGGATIVAWWRERRGQL